MGVGFIKRIFCGIWKIGEIFVSVNRDWGEIYYICENIIKIYMKVNCRVAEVGALAVTTKYP